MINNDKYICYNHIDKSLLRIIKIASFESKGSLQRIKLAATLKINNIDIIDELRKALSEDSFAVELIDQLETGPVEGFVVVEDLLTFQGKVYLPRKLRSKFLELCHAKPESGYFECDLCRRTKHERHHPYGELQPPRAPTIAWSLVAMDWIVKLPAFKDPISKNSYDSIFVIVDRLIGYGIFLFY